MLFRPAVLAMLLADGVALLLLVSAALVALRDRRQRFSDAIPALVGFALVAELVVTLLFVLNADRMAPYFLGAECATGALNADPFGFPALILRLILTLALAAWLVLHYLDSRHEARPLTPRKLRLLPLIPLLLLAVSGVQIAYFLGLQGDLTSVVHSCCGSIFNVDVPRVAADLRALPAGTAEGLFLGVTAATLAVGGAVGVGVVRLRRGYSLFALLAVATAVAGVALIISSLSPHLYGRPDHHCPICLLRPEFNALGYLLYPPLFIATALALGVGVSAPSARRIDMEGVLAGEGRRLVIIATALFALFALASMVVRVLFHAP